MTADVETSIGFSRRVLESREINVHLNLVVLPPFLSPGVKENSIDSLVFDTLIPKPIIQRYLNLLMEHRRIILSGPSGTGKSFLAAKLAEYIISQMGQKVTEHNVASFNVDQNSSKVGRGIQTQQLSYILVHFDDLCM